MRRFWNLKAVLLMSFVVSLMVAGCGGGGGGGSTSTTPAATLVSIAVTPSNPAVIVDVGATQNLKAVGTYSDGTLKDITSSVAWSSGTPSVATVNGGVVSGVATGTASITATSGSLHASVAVGVPASALVSITVNPPNPTLNPYADAKVSAIGTYADTTTLDLTSSVAWSSTSNTIAAPYSVNGQWVVVGVAAGSATITATSTGGITGAATVTVNNTTLSSAAITPVNPTVAVGGTQQMTATGTWSDASTGDLTYSPIFAWYSTSKSVATVGTIDTGFLGTNPVGMVTGVAVGSSTIQLILMTGATTLMASTTVTVN